MIRLHNQILLPGSQVQTFCGGHTGLVRSELDTGSWPCHCVVFLGKTLYFHKCLSTPGSINRYRQIAREEIKKYLGVNLGMDWHPIQEREGEVQILLVASRHKNLPAELATCLKYRLNLLPQIIYCTGIS